MSTDPEPVTWSAQCVGMNCAQAASNFGCERGDGWCNTVVLGFMASNPKDELWKGYFGFPLHNLGRFLLDKGISEGDILTHIDGKYIHEAGALAAAEKMSDGTMLTIWNPRDKKQFEVKL